jgi:pimeloyl-ACP methyl ester carboxylesterase
MNECRVNKEQVNLSDKIEIPEYQGAITKVFKSQGGLQAIYQQYENDMKQWPVPYKQKFLTSVFGKTYCIQCGDESKPPLVMLHGIGVNSSSFSCNIKALSKDYCVYLLDFPAGSGRSIPSSLLLKKRQVADWLNDCIAQLEKRKVTVLGTSFGSWIAAEYALTQPNQLKDLILTSPPPLAGKAKLKFSTLLKMIVLGINKKRTNIEKLYQLLSAPNCKVDNEIVTAMFNGLNHTKSFKESGHAIKKKHANIIDVPIHFILGKYEILCDPDSLPGHFPNAKISIIDNAGHMLPVEQSQKFDQQVLEIMSS